MNDTINSRDDLETVVNTELCNLRTYISGWCDRLFSVVKDRLPCDVDVNMADLRRPNPSIMLPRAFPVFPQTDPGIDTADTNNNILYQPHKNRPTPRRAYSGLSGCKRHRLWKELATRRFKKGPRRTRAHSIGMSKGLLSSKTSENQESVISTDLETYIASLRVGRSKLITDEQPTNVSAGSIQQQEPGAISSAISTSLPSADVATSMLNEYSSFSDSVHLDLMGSTITSLWASGQKPSIPQNNFASTSAIGYQPAAQSSNTYAVPPGNSTSDVFSAITTDQTIAFDESSIIKAEPWSEDFPSTSAIQSDYRASPTVGVMHNNASGPSYNNYSNVSTTSMPPPQLSVTGGGQRNSPSLNEIPPSFYNTITPLRTIIRRCTTHVPEFGTCDVCNEFFIDLCQHVYEVHRPFACPHCAYRGAKKRNLVEHMRRSHEKNRYQDAVQNDG